MTPDLSYPERVAAAAEAGKRERTRIVTEAWNAYLGDVMLARKAMPGHPDDIEINHIIDCRTALAAAIASLDEIEVRLPASKMHVRPNAAERRMTQDSSDGPDVALPAPGWGR
jgi:hypothetical protein